MTSIDVGPARWPAIRAIAWRDWRDWRRDRRLLGLVLLTTGLMLAALLHGASRAAQVDRDQAAAAAADGALWAGQGAKHPHAAAHFGQYAFKPESPLALADPGVDAYVGNAVWLEAHRRNEPQFRAARDGDLASRYASLSLAFVLQTLMPLVVILIAFASFSGERERGTLRQVLSVGTAPLDLLAGKALAVLAAISLLLAPAALVLVALCLGSGEPWAERLDRLARCAGLMLGYALYLGGFAALALAVSAASRRSRTALTALLGFWLLNGFVAPRLMTDIARDHHPLPTTDAFQAAIAAERRAAFGHDEQHPAWLAFRDETLRRYGVTRIEALPVSFRALALRHDDETGYAIFDRHYAQLQAAYAAGDAWRAAPGLLLPLLAIQPYSMALAGADSRHHEHFSTAAESHRRRIQTLVSDDLLGKPSAAANYQADPALWSRIPAFDYEAPSAAWALASQRGNLLSLLLWLLITSGLAVLAARRIRAL